MRLPRKVRREHAYLTDAQVWQLASEAGPDKGLIVLVLVYCGLRWGELAGLHVADIDTLRRRIHVRRVADAHDARRRGSFSGECSQDVVTGAVVSPVGRRR